MLVKYIYMYSNKWNHPNKYNFYIILQYVICNILYYAHIYIQYISTHMIKIGFSSFYFL
jgi:hypothetical protein